ncbi:MAG: prepilin peptidase, partial [Pseudonocardiaceae bacterium]
DWAVAGVCALVAAACGAAVPRVIRALSEPEPDDSAGAASDGVGPSYAAIATSRGGGTGLGVWAAAVAGVLAGAIGGVFGADLVLVGLVPLVPVGVALAYVDARRQLLPTRIVAPATLAAAVLVVLEAGITQDVSGLVQAAVGWAVAGGALGIVWWFSGGNGFGFGDVRLAGLIGLVTARVDWSSLVISIYSGLAAATLYAIALRIITRDREALKRTVPLGPFLLAGAWVGIIAGGW